jgi:hypothetical protein
MSADLILNIQTVSRYQGWSSLPKETVVGYAKTVFKESHRLPDEWSFSIKEHGLYDETRGGYVHKIVKDYPHPNTYLRELEDGIISAMDRWAISNQEGYLVWISPSFKGHYPCHKIEIIHKTESATKTDNMVILFDGGQDVCLAVAKQIFTDLKVIKDVEELRNSIITPAVLDINRIIEIVGPYIPTSEDVMDGTELELHLQHIAKLAISGASQSTIANEMDRIGLIGKHSFSCPGGGLSNTLLHKSNIIEAKYVKNCGQCGTTIEAHIAKGYKCPNCGGVYEGC